MRPGFAAALCVAATLPTVLGGGACNAFSGNTAPQPLSATSVGVARWWATVNDSASAAAEGGASVCAPYSEGACCTNAYQNTLQAEGPSGLYPGFNYSMCGPTSLACKRFFSQQECHFSCDPFLSNAYANTYNGGPPIELCPNLCNDWFDACRDDLTCAFNWQSWDDIESRVANWTGTYFCPLQTEGGPPACKTFAQMYGNSANMCNNMWGSTYRVGRDPSKCTTFAWYGTSNPNAPPAPAAAARNILISQDLFISAAVFGIAGIVLIVVLSVCLCVRLRPTPAPKGPSWEGAMGVELAAVKA